MSRRKTTNPDQFDLFEPPHEWCEDGGGLYLQFLIAPPSELAARPGEGFGFGSECRMSNAEYRILK